MRTLLRAFVLLSVSLGCALCQSITISISPPTAIVGQNVTVTVNVFGIANNTVLTFNDGGASQTPCPATGSGSSGGVVANVATPCAILGTKTVTTSAFQFVIQGGLAAGPHFINACSPSVCSNSVSEPSNTPVTITLELSPASPFLCDSVTLRGTVNNGATGTINFYDNNSSTGTSVPVTSTSPFAQLFATFNSVGFHTARADFVPTGFFTPATDTKSLNITARTQTSLTAVQQSGGQYLVTVAIGTPPCTQSVAAPGTVTIEDRLSPGLPGSTAAQFDASAGRATITLTQGTHYLIANYSGSTYFLPSSSDPFVVNAGPGGGTAALNVSGGGTQSTLIGTDFPTLLQVTYTNSSGTAQSGVAVTFTTPASGPSAQFPNGANQFTATTNSSGVASVKATANNLAGAYPVMASALGLSATFNLTNTSTSSDSDLALNQAASQSSSYPGSPSPQAAVDGNTSGDYSSGTVTSTNQESNPWWQVDLGSSQNIGTIEIWNRTDCCGTRLSDYWVFVSDTPFQPGDTPASLQFRQGTFNVHQQGTPAPSSQIPIPVKGRYVRVQLSNPGYLSLAEVKVFAPGASLSNAAQGKPALQSSTFPGTPSASVAVDGTTDGSFYSNSVTATNFESTPWWQVDLLTPVAINSVKIFNRTDCCGERLNDYWVFVSNNPFGTSETPASIQLRSDVFAMHQTSQPSPTATIPVGVTGRYVRIQLGGFGLLSLAEVQVLTGGGGGGNPTDLAQSKPATQSSTLAGYPGAGAASAADGNTNGSFGSNSVTATNFDTFAWWQVDLQNQSNINSVRVWNRTDCCGERLSDYWVFVSSTPFLASDTPASLSSRPDVISRHFSTQPTPFTDVPIGSQGRYVRIQLSGSGYLSLAEVQVF